MTTSTTLSPQRAVKENRPPSNSRHPTAPSIMTVNNAHFAGVGETPTKEQYEHGIQVINEDQEFKYYPSLSTNTCRTVSDGLRF